MEGFGRKRMYYSSGAAEAIGLEILLRKIKESDTRSLLEHSRIKEDAEILGVDPFYLALTRTVSAFGKHDLTPEDKNRIFKDNKNESLEDKPEFYQAFINLLGVLGPAIVYLSQRRQGLKPVKPYYTNFDGHYCANRHENEILLDNIYQTLTDLYGGLSHDKI